MCFLLPFFVSFSAKVDVDANTEAAEKYGVEAMPTFKFVKGGEVVTTITGADEPSIRAALNQHK